MYVPQFSVAMQQQNNWEPTLRLTQFRAGFTQDLGDKFVDFPRTWEAFFFLYKDLMKLNGLGGTSSKKKKRKKNPTSTLNWTVRIH